MTEQFRWLKYERKSWKVKREEAPVTQRQANVLKVVGVVISLTAVVGGVIFSSGRFAGEVGKTVKEIPALEMKVDKLTEDMGSIKVKIEGQGKDIEYTKKGIDDIKWMLRRQSKSQRRPVREAVP